MIPRPALTPEEIKLKSESGVQPQRLMPGYVWNPLKRFPRNHPCVCGSDRKFKSCCEPNLRPAMREAYAKEIIRYWNALVKGEVHVTQPKDVSPVREQGDGAQSLSGAEPGITQSDGSRPLPEVCGVCHRLDSEHRISCPEIRDKRG